MSDFGTSYEKFTHVNHEDKLLEKFWYLQLLKEKKGRSEEINDSTSLHQALFWKKKKIIMILLISAKTEIDFLYILRTCYKKIKRFLNYLKLPILLPLFLFDQQINCKPRTEDLLQALIRYKPNYLVTL